MKHIVALPSMETLEKMLTYDEVNGGLVWNGGLAYQKQRPAGATAGTVSKGGYLRVSISRKMYAVHRVVWKIHHRADPCGIVDHKDGNKLNNRIENLRDVTQRENLYNSVIRSDNKTGYKGVVYSNRCGRYTLNLKSKRGRLTGLFFNTAEEAADALRTIRKTEHGEYACHGYR